ncbi:hypothetical protein BRARA_I02450 [Brassica rapa]|uniref:Uncharacterized protein n=1 Tax=Brassica campestris TaxID=3711 RepID=A0A397XYW5_BRACM|nr:hypothetical protein BRARA_I02450 [Brassica rapa]
MSYTGDITFNVYHGGYWVKMHDRELAYVHGGEMKVVECKPEEILTVISDELCGHRLWYKMPSEDNKERKSLVNGDLSLEDVSFEKMCLASKWSRAVDLFLVNNTEHPDDVDCPEPCEEQMRAERNVSNFVDEDEQFDYHNTPPNSDGEEEEENFVRWKKGSGELKLRHVFETLDDFKEALVDYMLKEGWNIQFCTWGKDKSAAKCGIEDANCPWRIYCSYEEAIGKWMVKTYEYEHSCVKDGYSKMLKSPVITKLYWMT